MTNPEVENLVETIYQKLRALLSLYVETDAFFKVPEGEAVSESHGEDAVLEFVERKISEIRKSVEPQLLGEEIVQRLNQIFFNGLLPGINGCVKSDNFHAFARNIVLGRCNSSY